MKRFLLFCQFMFVVIILHATGQTGDIIYIDGARWELLGRPVCLDSALYYGLKAVLPEKRSINTSNWDGFTSYWSIQQDLLYLDSIKCEHYDPITNSMLGERISSDKLLKVFNKYVDRGRIVARWLSREIRVAAGKKIYYQHIGFERNYEEEKIISIDKGKVTGWKEFHNFVVDGYSFEKINSKNKREELQELFPLHIEQYPELACAERIVFYIKRAKVDAQGNLVECEVEVKSPNDNPRLAAEMAELMKAYHPWEVLFINGEYRADGIEGWTVPYLLDE